MAEQNRVLSNVAITGQVTGGISDETLSFYKEINNNNKEARMERGVQGRILSDLKDIITEEADKWNNYIDFVLNSYLSNMDKNGEVISKFINTISKGQESYLKDIFKRNAIEGKAESEGESEFRMSILSSVAGIAEAINNLNKAKADKNKVMTETASGSAGASIKAQKDEQGKGGFEKFKASSGNINAAIGSISSLIKTLKDEIKIKDMLVAYKNLQLVKKYYNIISGLLEELETSDVNFKAVSDNISNVSKTLDPLFKLTDKFESANYIKSAIKTVAFINLFEYVVYRLNNLNKNTEKTEFDPKSYERIVTNINTLNEVLTITSGLKKSLGAFFAFEKAYKVYEKGIDSLDNILTLLGAAVVDKKFDKRTINNINSLKEGIDAINGIYKPIFGMGIDLAKIIILEKIYTKGIDSLDNILTVIGAAFSNEIINKKQKNRIEDICGTVALIGRLTGALLLTGIGMAALIVVSPVLIAGLFVIKGIIMLMSWLFGEENMKELRKNISAFSHTLLLITASFLLFTVSLLAISQVALSPELLAGTLAFFGYITAVVGIMWLLGKVDKDIRSGALSLTLVGAALVTLALSLWAVSNIVNNINYDGMVQFFLCTAAVVGIMWLLGAVKQNILMGVLSIALLGISLVVLGACILAVSNMMNDVSMANLGIMMGATVLFAAIFGIVGIPVVAGLVALGSGVMLLMGISLLVFAKSIKSIADVFKDVDKKEIDAIVNNFDTFLSGISSTFVRNMPKLVLAGPGIMSAIGIGKAISNLSEGIRAFANLTIPTAWDEAGRPIAFRNMTNADFQSAAVNIGLILSTFVEPLKAFGGSGRRKEWVAAKKGIKNAQRIGSAIGSLAEGVQAMALLRMPLEWDKNGKPIKFTNMTTADFQNVAININTILSAFSDGILEWAGNHPEYFDSGWFTNSLAGKAIKMASKIGGAVGNLAVGVQAFGNLKAPKFNENGDIVGYEQLNLDKAKIAQTIGTIFDVLIDAVGDKNNITKLEKASKHVEKIAPGVEQLAGMYKNLSDASKDFDENKFTLIPVLNNCLIDSILQYDSYKDKILSGYEIANKVTEISGTAINNINKISGERLNNFDKFNANYEKFVQTSNKIDIKPINAMSQMLDKMNVLIKSQGSIDKFTDAIGNKLTPVLTELVETLLGLEEKYENKSSNAGNNENNTGNISSNNIINNQTINNPSDDRGNNANDASSKNKPEQDIPQLVARINQLVSTIQSGLSVTVKGDVAVKNSLSNGPLKVSSGI